MKRGFFSIALVLLLFCSLARADNPARSRLLFNINLPYTVKAGELKLPAGEYAVRDLGISTYNLLTLNNKDEREPIAFLYCVMIDRRMADWTDKPTVVFDLEHGMPAMKKILLPAQDGYEIIGAVGSDKYQDTGFTFEKKARATITTETIEQPPAPVAVPELLPPPAMESPKAEPQIEAVPPAEPPPPVKERKRVRKD